jgi:hypothetical protein
MTSVRNALGLACAAALSLTSCGKINHMQDNMDAVKDGTEKMGKTTDDMAKTTKRMEDTTCKMYTSLRQGDPKKSRDDDIATIESSKSVTKKLETAGKLMYGLEYQVWSLSCADISPRDVVMEQAATDLLTGIEPYVKDRSKVSATKQSGNYETLYAIAATLHKVNPLQRTYLKGTDEKIIRPLDIIVQGLKLNQQKNRGQIADDDTFPVWATSVGKYADDAQFLLRVRANFLMAYGYAVADQDDFGDSPSLLEKLWRIGSTKIANKKWTPNLDGRDPTTIRERITVSLQLAKETRDALLDLGIDPMVDNTIMKVWQDADFSSFDLDAMSKGKGDDPARAKAIKELMVARERLLQHGASGTW